MTVVKRDLEEVKFGGYPARFSKEDDMNNLLLGKAGVFDISVFVVEGKANVSLRRKIDGGGWHARFAEHSFTFNGVKQSNSLVAWLQVKSDGLYAKGVCTGHIQLLRKEGIQVDGAGSINLQQAKKALDLIKDGRVGLNGFYVTKSRLEEIVAFADEIEEAGKLYEDVSNLLKSKIVSDYVEKKKMQTMFLK